MGPSQRRARGRDEPGARAVAIVRVLGHPPGHDAVDGRRQVPAAFAHARRRILDVGMEHLVAAGVHERGLPGQALEQQAREGIDVDAVIEVLSQDLLGRRVVVGAHERAGGREGPAVLDRVPAQPEVREIGALVAVRVPSHDHVSRLDVAMPHSGRMDGVQGARDLAEDRDGPLDLERPVRGERPEVLAVHIVHRHVEHAVVLAAVAHPDDVGMLDGARVLPLAQEARAELVAARQLGRQHLQGELSVARDAVGQIDGAHAALADQLGDPVAADFGAHFDLVRGR